MRICVPTVESKGLQSKVSGHFGSAPYFIIADTESGAVEEVKNTNQHHSHGMCHPLSSLAGYKIDALVCSGIGAGALGRLKEAGITAYGSQGSTVAEMVEGHRSGKLEELTLDRACGHHGCHSRR